MKQDTIRLGFILLIMALLLPATVQAKTDFYGKLQVAYGHIDDETDANDYWDVRSEASRVGIKGVAPTDFKSLNVIYKLEWQINVTDDAGSSSDHIKGRNQYVGLEGAFGQVIIGRHDTPLKTSQFKMDLFNDYIDIGGLMAGNENRVNNIIQYSTPKMGDAVTFKVMGWPGEEPDGENNNPVDAYSTSVAYDSDGLHVALAHDSEMDGENVDSYRVIATWKFGSFGLGGMLQTTDWDTPDSEDVVMANFFYDINKVRIKIQLGHTENYGGLASNFAGDENTVDYNAFGVDYTLGKNSILGAFLGLREGGDGLDVHPDIGGPYSRDVFGVILIHKF